jgi:hypothetical protein
MNAALGYEERARRWLGAGDDEPRLKCNESATNDETVHAIKPPN